MWHRAIVAGMKVAISSWYVECASGTPNTQRVLINHPLQGTIQPDGLTVQSLWFLSALVSWSLVLTIQSRIVLLYKIAL